MRRNYINNSTKFGKLFVKIFKLSEAFQEKYSLNKQYLQIDDNTNAKYMYLEDATEIYLII